MNKISIYFLFFIFSNHLISQNNINDLNLMPFPKSIDVGESRYYITKDIQLHYDLNSERLKKASNRFLQRFANKTGIFLTYPFAVFGNGDLDIQIAAKSVGTVKLGNDESYKLEISENKIILSSITDIGAIRGIETLLQLVMVDEKGYYFPDIKIKDSPRFPWRGLMIDACRHFMPVDVIKRNLDAMAAVKMNVFHWHLSEDQGYRLESKVFPKLHEFGSDGNYYTQSQILDIVKYADDRGIRVIPEIDIPGHATAILTAYPEIASAKGEYKIERKWGVFDPTLDPTNEKTYEFLSKLFDEIVTLFPDEYFHIGGDENNGKQWNENPKIQEFMKENGFKDNHELQGYFNQKLLLILTNLNRKMIGWDEIFHPSMPNNIVIQSWRGTEALVESAKKGYQAILSNGYYIDLIQPTDYHYLNDPLPSGSNLTDEEKGNILGGETTMWAEYVNYETVDSRIWPRTAAIAERFWSPQEINDVEDMYKRLEAVSQQLEEHGLLHIKNFGMMLRRLTNNQSTTELKTLISVIEPVKIYNRNRVKKHSQQSPLTRVIDAATPDAKVAREFRNLVDNYLHADDKQKIVLSEQIKSKLELWKTNHLKLKKVIKKSPILFEIEPMSEKLKSISQLGIEIIESIKSKKSLDNEWKKSSSEIIQSAKEPVAQTELMIVSAIEKLFNTVNKEK